jgi:hypothetical protein
MQNICGWRIPIAGHLMTAVDMQEN